MLGGISSDIRSLVMLAVIEYRKCPFPRLLANWLSHAACCSTVVEPRKWFADTTLIMFYSALIYF